MVDTGQKKGAVVANSPSGYLPRKIQFA